MQFDKVLLAIFLSVLAGFFTAALSIVKLVNDKENKTTDYRQAWTDSLRKCFADLISNINLLASCLADKHLSLDDANELAAQTLEQEGKEKSIPEFAKNLGSYFDKRIHDQSAHIQELQRNLHQSYALTRLHFKPNDLSFSRVEQKVDVIVEMLQKLTSMRGKEVAADRLVLREKLHAAATELTGYSRDILKTEWEAVKKGEKAYQRTKTWSIVSGGIALFVLIIFGMVTAWKILRNEQRPLQELPSSIVGEAGRSGAGGSVGANLSAPVTFTPPLNSQVVTVYTQPNCNASPKGPVFPKKSLAKACAE